MKTLFPDTNLFLQCKDFSQINWEEIADGMDLCLLISRPVQEEIDRLKHDGNTRRAKRARKATTLIREIILSEGTKKVIKDSAPKVEISVSPPIDTSQKPPGILDLSRPDDRIIAEAIAYKNSHPNIEVAILTHDTNLILTTKRCNFDFIVIPEDWLMEPEPDMREKKILELERKIRELERNYPEIEVICHDIQDNRIEYLSISIIQYKELTGKQIERLVAETRRFYPMANNFNRTSETASYYDPMRGINSILGIMHEYIPPTEGEIDRYKKEEYPNWIETIKEFYRGLHKKLESPFRQGNISVSIKNIGNVPAEHLLAEFTLVGGLLFMPPTNNSDKSDEELTCKIPSPPAAPRGRWIQREVFGRILSMEHRYPSILSMEHSIPSIPRFNWNRERDKHAFYWKPRRPTGSSDSWIFECEEFRHQVEPEIFNATIWVPPNNIIKSGALKCRITAKNLPKPVEYVLPIEVKYDQGDTFDRARKLLNPFVFNPKQDPGSED